MILKPWIDRGSQQNFSICSFLKNSMETKFPLEAIWMVMVCRRKFLASKASAICSYVIYSCLRLAIFCSLVMLAVPVF